MKKLLITFAIITFSTTIAHAAGFDGGLNSTGSGFLGSQFGGMQNPNEQLRLLENEKFRKQEYNEFQDMKQVKEKRNQKLEYEQKLKEQAEAAQTKKPQASNVEFYMENGRMKLRSIQ